MRTFLPQSLHWLRRSPRVVVMASLILGFLPNAAFAQIEEGNSISLSNTAQASYQGINNPTVINILSNQVDIDSDARALIDPTGLIVDCEGVPFDSYAGFSVALFNAAGSTGAELGSLVNLPSVSPADLANSTIVNVNPSNDNPFDVGITDSLDENLRGRFNFLLSPEQIQPDDAYILVIQPPPDLLVDERRIRIADFQLTGGVGSEQLTYRAISLDGLPLSVEDSVPIAKEIVVPQGQQNAIFLTTAVTPLCQSQAIRIRKTADRVTTQPGSFVVYQITIENLSTSTLENVTVNDRLPRGFSLLEDSVQAQIGDNSTPITTVVNGRSVSFEFQEGLPGNADPSNNPVARIAYVTEVNPDALRGDGRNVALASGDRTDNSFVANDGPAIFEVDIREDLLSDLGTIIGRVFVDKNFDGEQQFGEPGVPNAVVFMENGNRIVTDKDGLFSVANVYPGWHTGALDLTSVPGYTLAPNPYILRKESQSQAVRVEPGGLARLNFAVTPVVEGAR
ncbi:DUF11 domain-containing protein [[Limnothrix rosea] IAM M-220]|uniref:DUF11 domain-containing protein n=1 Tax=[Limnothrix rosea] IAM M-220 TaxID=454133 RepID=UPI000961E15E|nr:DUF11 domain-containing protein [[Limnothrix rosea] IAM M-220]OKH19922.1 hypothetical protein NIES208_00105 [[Limnothrix rosea] IAM M-220]